MPVISIFGGIVVRMYYFDTQRHALPHIHVQYGEQSAVFSIEDGTSLAGNIPPRATRLVGATLSPIDPLR